MLDLLGGPEPRFYNYFPDTEGWYYQLVDIESRLGAAGFLVEHAHNSAQAQSHNAQSRKKRHQGYFQPFSIQVGIEDDHLPFLRRNVSVNKQLEHSKMLNVNKSFNENSFNFFLFICFAGSNFASNSNTISRSLAYIIG